PQRAQPLCPVATQTRVWSTLDRLPRLNEEEGGDDVKSGWPLRPGLHTYYNAQYRTTRNREVEEITKTEPSSDCRLQLAYMKPESLVMAYQLRRREYVPGPCTHRPSHHGSRLYPKCLCQSAQAEGRALRYER